MENLTGAIYTILGLGTLFGAFKSIDWAISTKYKTKEKIGYKIVDELEILLENMCNLKK